MKKLTNLSNNISPKKAMNWSLNRSIYCSLRSILIVHALFFTSVLHSQDEWIPGVQLHRAEDFNIRTQNFNFTIETSSENTFPSFKIKPHHGILFDVPEQFHQMTVDQIVLSHRQNSHNKSVKKGTYDETPGLTSVLFYDQQGFEEGRRWRFWKGPSSGIWGAKYAELKLEQFPELELLYSFNYYGTSPISLDESTKSNQKNTDTKATVHEPITGLRPTKLAIVNVGKSSVFLHQLQARYLPPTPSEFIEKIYSEKTQFDDFKLGRAINFGGGESSFGKYPKAHRLRKNEKLYITINKKMKISAVDVICGDAKGWNRTLNTYNPGRGFLNIKWLRKDEVLQNLMLSENVGAQSMLRGIPEQIDEVTELEDKIELSNTSDDPIYIMGYRVGLRELE